MAAAPLLAKREPATHHVAMRPRHLHAGDLPEPEWRVLPALTDYRVVVEAMEARVAAIRAGEAREAVWLLEHPPLLTAGTSADPAELLDPERFPVHASGRGGRYTYHGPGQRVGYVMLDLARRGPDVRRFVAALEQWLISALGDLGVAARREPGRIGIWVDDRQGREAKIGAIGIRIRRWVSLHGFAVNISPTLTHFDAVVPCGLLDYPVASTASLGTAATMEQFDGSLRAHFRDFLQSLG